MARRENPMPRQISPLRTMCRKNDLWLMCRLGGLRFGGIEFDRQTLGYRRLALQGQAPIAEVLARDPADLAGALNVLCGSDEATLERWRVYVAFWHEAARSPMFAAEQRLWIEKTLALIGEVIVARTGRAENVRELATELIALVYGTSVQRRLDPARWTAEAIAAVIERKVREVDLRG